MSLCVPIARGTVPLSAGTVVSDVGAWICSSQRDSGRTPDSSVHMVGMAVPCPGRTNKQMCWQQSSCEAGPSWAKAGDEGSVVFWLTHIWAFVGTLLTPSSRKKEK